MSQKRLFVDLDETLAKTKHLSPNQPLEPGWCLIEFKEQRWQTIARPGARLFLEAVQHLKPSVLTTGGTEFQTLVLQALGLRELVDQVIGADSRQEIVVPGPWVLLDDLPADACGGIMSKFKRLGVGTDYGPSNDERWPAQIERHLVHCEMFAGKDDPYPLVELISAIEAKLLLQS